MEQLARIDLNALNTFYWVARLGSFTAAARALHLQKSSVSRQVSSLEGTLGTRLMERTTRRLSLTESGQLFLSHCERVMAEAQDAERAVNIYTAEPRGMLRVGVPVTFGRVFLAPVLLQFCRKYPQVKLEILVRGGRLDPVENQLDLVIHVGRLADSSYVMRKLGALRQGLYASKGYLRKHSAPRQPAELAAHAAIMISRAPNSSRWQLTHASGAKEEIRLDPQIAVNDPVMVHRFASAGLGIAVLPEFLARQQPSLVAVLPQWRPNPVEFFAIYPDRRMVPPKLRVFLEELAANLRMEGQEFC